MTTKPDLTRVWASGAPGGNIEDPDVTVPGKFAAGWDAEIPPFENFNFLQQLFTQGLAHANEFGIMQWDTDTEYPLGGWARSTVDDEVYVSLTASNQGNEPSASAAEWRLLKDTFVTSSRKNSLINSRFRVNQRSVSGTVVLAAGEYGHDRFRGGSGGCTYTFSTSGGVTTLTISAGTLEQEILADNIKAGNNILSWEGTAQGQIDGGGFGTSGNVSANLSGSANVICEWNTGTLTKCQLEQGDTVTPVEFKTLYQDILECQYYYKIIRIFNGNSNYNIAGTQFHYGVRLGIMHTQPALSSSSGATLAISYNTSSKDGLVYFTSATPTISTIYDVECDSEI
jgi:hypothetical protein